MDALPRRDGQHLFVNGRIVQDRSLAHAIGQAYSNTMPRGRHPVLFLFVEVSATDVDVNVHPQKTEVRFRHAGRVHDLVRDAVRGALGGDEAIPELSDLRPGPGAKGRPPAIAAATLRYLARQDGPFDVAVAEPAATRQKITPPDPLPAPDLMRAMEAQDVRAQNPSV